MTPDPREQALAERVVARMVAHDEMSQWLGLEVVEVAPRRVVCRMTARPEQEQVLVAVFHGTAYRTSHPHFRDE